jgi:2-polyprenyl-3-methyl-5-hydroxy-6-metoxy-1,4-benzoquinol methylase
MFRAEGHEYFAARNMGQVLEKPFDVHWWEKSKYRLCVGRFDPLPPTARILDIGCGLGLAAYRLAELAGEVTALDLSSFAIEFAETHYRRENLRYVHSDIFEFEPDAHFDVVYCMDLIEHLDLENVRGLLRRLHGFLKDEGKLVVHVPIAESRAGNKKLQKYRHKHPDQSGILDHTGDPTHKTTFSVHSFRAHLEQCGFRIEREIQKFHCWRPLRVPFSYLLALPGIPRAWRDEATYSYMVQAAKTI